MKSDLHIHTNYSDGTSSIDDIIEFINSENPEIVAVTDHDTIDGFKELISKENQITSTTKIISGVEITTTLHFNDKVVSVHVLGYGFDYNDNNFINFLYKNNSVRIKNLKKAVDELYNAKQIKLAYDEIISLNQHVKGLHLTHVFDSLFDEEVTYEGVRGFRKQLKFDKMEYCSIEEAITAIRNAGGVAVLAHPKRTCKGDVELFNKLMSYDFEGLEIFYPNHNLGDIIIYLKQAKNRNMIITGGTDWHGDFSPVDWVKIGEVGLTDSETFMKRLNRKTGNKL